MRSASAAAMTASSVSSSLLHSTRHTGGGGGGTQSDEAIDSLSSSVSSSAVPPFTPPPSRRTRTARVTEHKANKVPTDMIFVGATVSTSATLTRYAEMACRRCGSRYRRVLAGERDNFVQQLHNRFLVCAAQDFLPALVQMLNLHASKKHFIFFNSAATLHLVARLFRELSRACHPLLYVEHVYVMYEGMREGARMHQYSQFLAHTSTVSGVGASATTPAKSPTSSLPATASLSSSLPSAACKGATTKKHAGAPQRGRGAVLLCTDMAAYGLDVRDVDYVYHFEPPLTLQAYVHRIGRVGRMGMRGCSMLILPICTAAHEHVCGEGSRRSEDGMSENRCLPCARHESSLVRTKNASRAFQSTRVTEDQLDVTRRTYLQRLQKQCELQGYTLPPCAPLSSTIRCIIAGHPTLLRSAKQAALCMCKAGHATGENWFDPKLALRSLLLD